MGEYLAPGVFVEEIAGARPIEGVSTATAAFVGYTAKGVPNTPILITSFGEYSIKFGGFNILDDKMPFLVKHFFDEGGSRAYIVRHEGTGGNAAYADVETDESPSNRAFTATATSIGKWGNDISLKITKASNGDDKFFNLSIKDNDTSMEEYENISLNPDEGPAFIENAVNNKSDYISVSVNSAEYNSIPNIDSVFELTNGLGDTPDNYSEIVDTTIQYLDEVDDINMLICPNITDEGNHRIAANYCEKRKDCFYIASVDTGENTTAIIDERSDYGYNSRSALYAPWIIVNDPRNGSTIKMPPSGAVAGIYARTDVKRGVFKSPAGILDGNVNSANELEIEFTKGDQEFLNPLGINVIRNIPGGGNVIWGARTLSSDPQWKYVCVRRLIMYIETSVEKGIKWAVFEPNSPLLWSKLRRDVESFLRVLWKDGGLYGAKESEAFYVKIDEENNPPASRDLGRLIVNIGVAPIKPAEFVIIRIEQMREDV